MTLSTDNRSLLRHCLNAMQQPMRITPTRAVSRVCVRLLETSDIYVIAFTRYRPHLFRSILCDVNSKQTEVLTEHFLCIPISTCRVNSQVYTEYTYIHTKFQSILNTLVPGKKVVFTGFGMCGGVALYAAWYHHHSHSGACLRPHVVTFGSYAIGNHAFNSKINFPVVRVVLQNDVVPQLNNQNHLHTGSVICFNDDMSVTTTIPSYQKSKALMRRAFVDYQRNIMYNNWIFSSY
jgi:hypothetical protein